MSCLPYKHLPTLCKLLADASQNHGPQHHSASPVQSNLSSPGEDAHLAQHCFIKDEFDLISPIFMSDLLLVIAQS